MDLNWEQRKIVRELAVDAGFHFDHYDCNLYDPAQVQWINKEIYTLAELILKNREKLDAAAT